MNTENENLIEIQNAEPSGIAVTEKVVPEFYRDLIENQTHKNLWHFSHRHSLENPKKPVRTPDGLPHKIQFSWNQIFPRATGNSPIEIEVGSGRGAFLAEYGRRHPEIFTLGSEWDYAWAALAMRKLSKFAKDNTAMLCGDIYYFLRDAVPDNSVDTFHMYFPDPWPKERHHKNRLLRLDFLQEVQRVLKPGKRIFYWGTDHAEYNSVALEIFDAFPGCYVAERNTAQPTEGIMTGFEIKYRKEGRPIYRSQIIFEK